MKNTQKIIIIAILVLPVLIGIGLLVKGGKSSSSLFSAASSFKKIGLVEIRGEIVESADIVRQLREFRFDNSIAGVLLRIDSPGGAVAPSQEIYTEVMRFREDKKPVIISMGNVAASGGYYIASAGQKIFSNPGTITGSIGVIFSVPMIEGLTKKIGVEFRTLKAGAYKDIGSMNRPFTVPEKELLQNLLDDTHDQFIGDVAIGRKMKKDSIRAIADGRIFTGRQALKVKLVDTLGGYEDALQYIKEITETAERSKVVTKKQRSSMLRDILTEEISKVIPHLGPVRQPGIYYVFDPSNFKF